MNGPSGKSTPLTLPSGDLLTDALSIFIIWSVLLLFEQSLLLFRKITVSGFLCRYVTPSTHSNGQQLIVSGFCQQKSNMLDLILQRRDCLVISVTTLRNRSKRAADGASRDGGARGAGKKAVRVAVSTNMCERLCQKDLYHTHTFTYREWRTELGHLC